jgi:DnaJ family protein B protein 4
MDYYQVLGALPRSCTDTDIKQQYRKCCLQWHPSRHEEDNKQTAAAHFR